MGQMVAIRRPATSCRGTDIPKEGRRARDRNWGAFLADLYQDWLEHGVHAVEQVRERRPWDYLKIIASLIPRDLHVGINELSNLSEDELRARMRQLDELVRPFLAKDDDEGTLN